MDPTSEVRKLFARVGRGESRDFFALHIGTELEKFERELAARAERVLSELGSASPALVINTFEAHVAQAVSLLEQMCHCQPSEYPMEASRDCPVHGDPAVLARLKDATT